MKENKSKGLVIVISAPSGAGKTTICKELLKSLPEAVYSVSVTTRKIRSGETNGKDYFFISEEEFKKMIDLNELAEWAIVHGHLYGTPKKFLEDTISSGKDIILDIDVQGGKKIKKLYPDGVFIFILPPSWEVLEERLRKRAQDDEQSIKTRLENAKNELSYLTDYEYAVINDDLQTAVKEIQAIIQSEHKRILRLGKEISNFIKN